MWDKLKSMVYEDAPAQKSAPVDEKTTKSPLMKTSSTLQPVQPAQPAQQASPEFVSAIRKVIHGRNSAFTQLLSASEKLVDIIPDGALRLKAAFKMAADGRTVQQVAAAVDVHLSDIENEERRFKAAIDQKVSTEVGAINARIATSERTSVTAAQQIEQLSARILELQQQQAAAAADAANAQNELYQKQHEIEDVQLQFKLAADAVRSELNSQKSAILSALT